MKFKRYLTLDNFIETVYILLAIAFIVCVLTKYDTAAFVFAIFLGIALLYNLLSPLFKNSKISPFSWIFFGINYIIAVVLFCMFVCLLPDTYGMKDVFTAVGSASLGGFLTLYGVGISIKYNRLHKKEDDIERLKPHVLPFDCKDTKSDKSDYYIREILVSKDSLKRFSKGSKIRFANIGLANSDLSICSFFGILVNDNLLKFKYETVVPKNSMVEFVINQEIKSKKVSSLKLLFGDALHNIYSCLSEFEIKKENGVLIIEVKSLYEGELWATGNQYSYTKIEKK